MQKINTSIETMELLGGKLCLDFVNTCEFRDPTDHTPVNDFLKTSQDFKQFLQRAKVVDPATLKRFRYLDQVNILQVRNLREFLYNSFLKFSRGQLIGQASSFLAAVNQWIEVIECTQIVGLSAGRITWQIEFSETNALSLLSPVLASAIELLHDSEPKRLRTCPADDCGWFFYDSSKSGKRVWCDMADCGNREKARKFYQSHKK